ncbi:head-tail connector protein [Sphingobacterium sp. ML3W]|uniref:head-tail connector protein n=1 Tax=Sphingobacterium sp. ML3W TaxID=1538644 RepID=UPI00249CEA72|nr:head-tail connector protein [Sphingobacterium sp. ML3W]WFA79655.1 head-tail connector protein [Sphingobacterium sp. ML3W]
MAITLQQAKNWLRIDFDDDNDLIQSLISTSEEWVQKYTCHILNPSIQVLEGTGCDVEIYEYPFNVTGSVGNYKVDNRSLKSVFHIPVGSSVTLSIGYQSLNNIPAPLITACLKLITYMYENRDSYSIGIPIDVQGLINQYRRGLF